MERNGFKEYSILGMMSKEVQQAMKPCFDELHLTFDANGGKKKEKNTEEKKKNKKLL